MTLILYVLFLCLGLLAGFILCRIVYKIGYEDGRNNKPPGSYEVGL